MTELSDRAKQTLKSLIDLYIREGTPVGSKTLANLPDIKGSPATIRHTMAELEAVGLIHSPHTSAGRIPTAKGYRFFVDSLLTVQPLRQQTIQKFQAQLAFEASSQQLLKSASQMLSGVTQMAGVVTAPKRDRVTLQQVEFIPLASHKVLVVLVLSGNDVQNRIIMTNRPFSRSELEQAGNYLTQHFAGKPLTDIREQIVTAMASDKRQIDETMSLILSMAQQTFDVDSDAAPDYVLEGHSNLLGLMNDSDVNSLQKIFSAFSQKQSILELLDQCLKADGVQIYIGEESGFSAPNCSLVTAPYQADGDAVGMIGVIGPTRMAYDKVIPIVDVTAKILSMAYKKE